MGSAVAVLTCIASVLLIVAARRHRRGRDPARHFALDDVTWERALASGVAAGAGAGVTVRFLSPVLVLPALVTGLLAAVAAFTAHRAWSDHLELDGDALVVRRWWTTRRVPLSSITGMGAVRARFVRAERACVALTSGERRTLYLFLRPCREPQEHWALATALSERCPQGSFRDVQYWGVGRPWRRRLVRLRLLFSRPVVAVGMPLLVALATLAVPLTGRP